MTYNMILKKYCYKGVNAGLHKYVMDRLVNQTVSADTLQS